MKDTWRGLLAELPAARWSAARQRSLTAASCLAALTLFAGCGESRSGQGEEPEVKNLDSSRIARAERDELRDDVVRFSEKVLDERRQLVQGFRDFGRNAGMEMGQALKCDTVMFLRWRKREWWRLTDDFATAFQLRWKEIEKLSADISRYYGYNMQNFPQTQNDVSNFLLNADPEWRNLVLDVAVFVEYQDREFLPLSEDLREFYQMVDWESANLEIDVRSFLAWREREYDKLVHDAEQFWAKAGDEYDSLVVDLHNYAAERLPEARLVVADLSRFFTVRTEHEYTKLSSGMARFTSFKRREWWPLEEDFQRWFFCIRTSKWNGFIETFALPANVMQRCKRC